MLQKRVFFSPLSTAADFVVLQQNVTARSTLETQELITVLLLRAFEKAGLDSDVVECRHDQVVDERVKFLIGCGPSMRTWNADAVGDFLIMQDGTAAG